MKSFAGEFEITGDRMVHRLGRRVVELYVVGGPPATEPFAARTEFAHQVGKTTIVGVSAGLGAQGGDAVGGDPGPFPVEVLRPGVEEQIAGKVEAGTAGAGIGEERPAQPVGGQNVHPAV